MNVLVHGIGNNFTGGVENFIINYFRNIDKSKIQFDFVCYNNKPAFYDELIEQGSHVYIITGRRKNYFKCYNQMKKIFLEKKYDAVWANVCSLSDILIIKFAYIFKIKKRIVHAHNSSVKSWFTITGILHKINKRKIMKYGTDFWTCSQKASQFMFPSDATKSDKYKIIRNAIDTKRFEFNKEIRLQKRKELIIDNKIIIGHIGRFHIQKNHKFLLEIFKEICKKKRDVILLLVGTGELLEQIKNQAKLLEIEEKVYFYGTSTNIPKLLNAMDVFLFPSYYEGLPIVLVEAQATGLGCIISDVITPEVIITDNVYPVSLKESAETWADLVIEKVNNERKNKYSCIKDNGYDIHTESKFLEKYFLEDNN